MQARRSMILANSSRHLRLPQRVLSTPVKQTSTNRQAVEYSNVMTSDLVLCTVCLYDDCVGDCSHKTCRNRHSETSSVSQNQAEGKQQDTILHIARRDCSYQ